VVFLPRGNAIFGESILQMVPGRIKNDSRAGDGRIAQK